MRESIRQFVRLVAETLPGRGPVFEFGARQLPGQERLADLRPLFPGKEFIGCDLREGPGVDRVLDLHQIDLPSGSVGIALILDTLEHVEFPHKALEEVHRVLGPDGIAVISSVMDFPIHEKPDYWRFTPEGFESVLSPFARRHVDCAGDERFPHAVVGIGLKDKAVSLDRFLAAMRTWKGAWQDPRKEHKRSWRTLAKRLVPPLMVDMYRKVRGR